jgi:integral membrane sensor domain MASE1
MQDAFATFLKSAPAKLAVAFMFGELSFSSSIIGVTCLAWVIGGRNDAAGVAVIGWGGSALSQSTIEPLLKYGVA